jgi:hypothetical protein
MNDHNSTNLCGQGGECITLSGLAFAEKKARSFSVTGCVARSQGAKSRTYRRPLLLLWQTHQQGQEIVAANKGCFISV